MPNSNYGLMRAHVKKQSPTTSFGSPLHANSGLSKDEKDQLKKDFQKNYGNNGNERIPPAQGEPTWNLTDILKAEDVQKIVDSGQLTFHTVGDTGFDSMPSYLDNSEQTISWNKINSSFQSGLKTVAQAMSADIDPNNVENGPAFFLHLGDVIYYDNTRHGYAEQFYDPFSGYNRKIIAIPGNHDVEVRLSQQNSPLEAFLENFCHNEPWIPPASRDISPPREMVAQPACYWRLETPFVRIIGLCSNVGENDGGTLEDPNTGPEQYAWFKQTMADVAANPTDAKGNRIPLLIAVHHPPFTHGNHDPSVQLSNQLDAVFKTTVWPDAVLAAHDHNEQRFTRTIDIGGKSVDIPYFVVGCGGRFSSQFAKSPPKEPPYNPGVELNHFGAGNGYMTVSVRRDRIVFDYRALDHLDQNTSERVTLDLDTRQIR